MTRGPTSPTPLALVKHHEYRSWTTTFYDADGKRKTKRFGKEKDMSRKAATILYQQWLKNEWKSLRSKADGPTVKVLATKYAEHCKAYYRQRGLPSTHFSQCAEAMNNLITAFGERPATELGAPEITQVRDAMVTSRLKNKYKRPDVRPLALSTVNGRLRIIKQMFAWARAYGWVSRECVFDVSIVKPLRSGRSLALDPESVDPVPENILAETLTVCPKTVADAIHVMYWTGMRPGELCIMRPCDIVRDGDVWMYHPEHHKTKYKGKVRVIPIGPEAQKYLSPYIEKRGLTEPIFLPADAHRERLEMIGFAKVTAYQMSRSHFKPGRSYGNDTFRNAIQRACDRKFDPKGVARKKGDYSHRWHPHQLRHNAATRIREKLGIEAVSDVLGHSSFNTSLIYAERSVERMKEIARKVG